MSKLLILRGLPASGKSTYARQRVREGWTRVSRDGLRAMLHGGRYTPENEQLVKRIEFEIIDLAIKAGRDIVVDDTNLNPETVAEISRYARGYEVEVLDFRTAVDECIARDARRNRSVGHEVIRGMAEKFGWPG